MQIHSLFFSYFISRFSLSQALLLDDETIAHAAALAAQMAAEDGVEGACQAFYKHLPVENMICDVSLFRGEYRLAQVNDSRDFCVTIPMHIPV